MGGRGSGRQSGRRTTSDALVLDVRKYRRDAVLKPGRSLRTDWSRNGQPVASIEIHVDHSNVILEYRHRRQCGEWQDRKYPVDLTWTPCHYGGKRVWWLCPGRGCGRRVAVLYLGREGIFACRHCYRLAYRCQRETADDRTTRRTDKLRDRLGWKAGIFNPIGGKPKGMHWKTFWQLKAEHDAMAQVVLGGIAQKMGFLQRLQDG